MVRWPNVPEGVELVVRLGRFAALQVVEEKAHAGAQHSERVVVSLRQRQELRVPADPLGRIPEIDQSRTGVMEHDSKRLLIADCTRHGDRLTRHRHGDFRILIGLERGREPGQHPRAELRRRVGQRIARFRKERDERRR